MFLSKKSINYLVFLITAIFLFFFYYYGIFHYQYTVPPGDDGMRHMSEAQEIMRSMVTKSTPGSLDPPLFHVLLVILSYFTKSTIVSLTLFFAPFLTILASLSLYFITRRFFNNKFFAALSPLILILFSPQPANIYDGGTYLNIFAAFYLMIFGLSVLPVLFLEKKINLKNIALVSIFFGAVILSHSLSFTYLVLIILFLVAVLLCIRFAKLVIRNLNRFFLFLSQETVLEFGKKIYFKNFLILNLILLAVFFPFTWHFYSKFFFEKISQSFFESETDVIEDAAGGALNFLPEISYYPRAIGTIIFGLSLIFSPYIYILGFKKRPGSSSLNLLITFFSQLLILSWVVALFFGSRFKFFVLPLRFGRDLVVPLVLIFCLFLISYLKDLRARKLIKYLIILLALFSLPNYFIKAIMYNKMVRLQNSDKMAISWIKNNTKKDDVILVYPPTLIMGSWGSYIHLFAERKAVDGEDCKKRNFSAGSKYEKCDQIYNPNSGRSKKFYKDESVDYVYAGKKILGHFIGEKRIDWNYQNNLSKAEFLKKVAEFEEGDLGKVIIFEVRREKIN